MISKKSVERLVIFRLLILPPCLPIVVVRLPRLPGSLAIVTLIRPTWLASSSLLQATSSQRSGVSAKLSSVSQSIVWIVTPLPVVTMPTMRSRQWVATTGEVQRHAGDQAADRHRRFVAFRLAPRPGQRDDLALGFLGLRKRSVGYCAPGNETLADRDIEILDGGAVEVLEYRLERPFRELLALLAERLLHD